MKSENRQKLTLGWRPEEGKRPVPVEDDYVEAESIKQQKLVPVAVKPAVCTTVPTVKGKSIRDRLENWARFERGADVYMGRGGGDCMTGIICERMRRAKQGELLGGNSMPIQIDELDAKLVAEAWKAMVSLRYKQILLWHYVWRAKPEAICRRFRIKLRPATVFLLELARAEQAIEKMLDMIGPQRSS